MSIGPANKGKSHIIRLPLVRPGDAVSAPGHNAAVEALNRQLPGVDTVRQVVGSADVQSRKTARQFRIKGIGRDHLQCVTFDGTNEGEETFNIAKPYRLRGSETTHNGITFVHTDTDSYLVRTASKAGEDDETWVITPAYVIEDLIEARKDIAGGTSAFDFSNKPIVWMDQNIDARAWARQAE